MAQIEILENLAKDYKDGRLSALVGAGFSKNVSNKFPDWANLLEDMYVSVHSDEIEKYIQNYIHFHQGKNESILSNDEIKKEYVKKYIQNEDLLALVSKYIKKNGFRECVDYYIEKRMPYAKREGDKNYVILDGIREEVSEEQFSAHIQLLKSDKFLNIYTTNYENLIEYANQYFVLDGKFEKEAIKTQTALSNQISNKNIIKIHGDLRTASDSGASFSFDDDNNLCYIIAQDDYDTYFEKHEAFSYMMRMAMLSGKFCLIGFSGKDANYLAWIKWMRDIIVKGGSTDTKIYLVTFEEAKDENCENSEISEAQVIFNKNFRIATLNLYDKDILNEIGYKTDVINQKVIDKTSLELDKREVLTSFLKYLNTQSINAGESIREISEIGNQRENSEYEANSTVLLAPKTDFTYKSLWITASDKLYKKESIDGVLSEIIKHKKSNRLAKVVYPQERYISYFCDKKEVSKSEAILFAIAVRDCGFIPDFYTLNQNVLNILNECEEWKSLMARSETIRGYSHEIIENGNDVEYENIMRSLFNLDFSKFKSNIIEWHPTDHRIIQASMLRALYIENSKDSLNILSDYISKSEEGVEVLYAKNVSNYISRMYPSLYKCDNYYDRGYDGLGDILAFIIRLIQPKVDKPKTMGWIGSTYNIGKHNSHLRNSVRLIMFLLDSGLSANYYGTYFLSVENWYQVCHNVLRYFPYPCFFYSIQYHDKDVLRRIGQEFAYCKGLTEENEDLLCKALKALGNVDTPKIFNQGLYYITARMYVAVDEEKWFQLFVENIMTPFLSNLFASGDNEAVEENFRMAVGHLKHNDHICNVLSNLLDNFNDKPEYVCSVIVNNLYVRSIDFWTDELIGKLIDLLEKTDSSYIFELIYVLNKEKSLDNLIIDRTITKMRALSVNEYPSNPFKLTYMLLLANSDKKLQSCIKDVLLKFDIWHCGLMDDGNGYSDPKYIRLHLLGNEVQWTDDEFTIIKRNLSNNVSKFCQSSLVSKMDSFRKTDMLQFIYDAKTYIETLPTERKQQMAEAYAELNIFLEKDSFDKSIENGLLSEQSSDVSNSIKQIESSIRFHGVSQNIDYLSLVLDRALLVQCKAIKTNLGMLARLISDSSKRQEILDLGYMNKYLTLLKVYRNLDSYEMQIDIYWLYNQMYTIAKSLETLHPQNEDIIYWLTDSWVSKFIRKL